MRARNKPNQKVNFEPKIKQDYGQKHKWQFDCLLSHIRPMFPFYHPSNHQRTRSFSVFWYFFPNISKNFQKCLRLQVWALELVKISPCQPWLLNGILFGCLYLKNAFRLIRYHVFWFCCYYLNRYIFFTSEIPSFIDVIQIEATLFF